MRKAYPDSTAGQDALYQAGVLSFEEGDYVTARKALNELLFENPLYDKANDARLKSGLAALELKAYRDAYQTLSSLVDKLEGDDKVKAQAALERAAAGSQQYGEALKLALKAVDAAASDDERKKALESLEETVESKTSFLSLAEAWHDLPSTHPAWPLVTFKLARVYYHLRDWPRLDETLKKLLADAPQSEWAPEAKALLERTARRLDVKPKVIGAVLPMTGKYKALGEAVVRGAQLALKGSDVQLVVKDSQGDVNLAGKLVEELAFESNAIAIIGPLLSDDSRRAGLVAEELQVPIITLTRTEGVTDIGPHVFRNMVTNQQQAEALADYAMGELGFKNFAVLYPNIPFGVELTDDFWTEVEKRGGVIRGAETYTHDQTTFTAEAKRLVGRANLGDRHEYIEGVREIRENTALDDYHRRKAYEKLRSNLPPVIDFEALLIPDAWQKVSLVAPALAVEDMVTNGCDKKDIERIMKTTGKTNAKDLKPVVLLGPSTWSSPKDRNGDYELVQRGGKFVLCSVYVDGFYEGSNRKATKAFVEAFHEAHKDAQPTLLDAEGFDTAGMLKQIIEKEQPKTRADMTARAWRREGLRRRDRHHALRRQARGAEAAVPFDHRPQGHQRAAGEGEDARGVNRLTAQARSTPRPAQRQARQRNGFVAGGTVEAAADDEAAAAGHDEDVAPEEPEQAAGDHAARRRRPRTCSRAARLQNAARLVSAWRGPAVMPVDVAAAGSDHHLAPLRRRRRCSALSKAEQRCRRRAARRRGRAARSRCRASRGCRRPLTRQASPPSRVVGLSLLGLAWRAGRCASLRAAVSSALPSSPRASAERPCPRESVRAASRPPRARRHAHPTARRTTRWILRRCRRRRSCLECRPRARST